MGTFVGIAQVDDVRLFGSKTSREQAAAVERTTPFQVQRLNPIAGETVQHVDVSFGINQEVTVVMHCSNNTNQLFNSFKSIRSNIKSCIQSIKTKY